MFLDLLYILFEGLFFSKLCHPLTFRENILIKINFEESVVKALLHFYSGKESILLIEYIIRSVHKTNSILCLF